MHRCVWRFGLPSTCHSMPLCKVGADSSRYSAASEHGVGRLKALRDRPDEPSGQHTGVRPAPPPWACVRPGSSHWPGRSSPLRALVVRGAGRTVTAPTEESTRDTHLPSWQRGQPRISLSADQQPPALGSRDTAGAEGAHAWVCQPPDAAATPACRPRSPYRTRRSAPVTAAATSSVSRARSSHDQRSWTAGCRGVTTATLTAMGRWRAGVDGGWIMGHSPFVCLLMIACVFYQRRVPIHPCPSS